MTVNSIPPDTQPTLRNPREQRVLQALLRGPVTRHALDDIAGASNSPALIQALRRRGFDIRCERVDAIDRDGRHCKPGVYHLSKRDQQRIAPAFSA